MHVALYQQEKVCPVCNNKFKVTRVKSAACPVVARDTDFGVRYSGSINPNHYGVWFCPRCGYAATDTQFGDLDDKSRRAILTAVPGRPMPQDAPERTPQMAIELYRQAIFCSELRRASRAILAGLHMRIAWIYRESEDPAEEQCLAEALRLYQDAFNGERFPIGKMTAFTVGYLVGDLQRRLGFRRDAVSWLSRLGSDPRLRTEPQIERMVRERWQEAKEELAQGLEGKTVWDGLRPQNARPVERISVSLELDGDGARWVNQVYERVRASGGDIDRANVVKALLSAVAGLDPSGLECATVPELEEALRRLVGA